MKNFRNWLNEAPEKLSSFENLLNMSGKTEEEKNALREKYLTKQTSPEQIINIPPGYRMAQDGVTLESIPGGPASRPTQQQGEAKLYSTRAASAHSVITGMEGKYNRVGLAMKEKAGGVWGVGDTLEAGANMFLSEEAQKVEQAQRNFVNAVLRRESGAAIPPEEFDNAKQQYFPQVGDKPGVIEQKRKNREEAINGIAEMAIPTATQKKVTNISGQQTDIKQGKAKFLGFE